MSENLILTEFIPGTKAKAEEINSNFSALKNAVAEKASSTGSSNSTFSVASATEDTHAVNKKQLDEVKALAGGSLKFCCNRGVTTEGVPSLLSYANNTVTLNSANAIFTDHLGTVINLSQDCTLDVSGISGTVYIYYDTETNSMFKTTNKHLFCYARPTTAIEDLIYIYPNNNAWVAEICKNSVWTTLTGCTYLGSYNATTATVTTNLYNQNGFDINSGVKLDSKTNLIDSIVSLTKPDYSSGTPYPINTVNQAPTDGYILFDYCGFNGSGGVNGYISFNATNWITIAHASAWTNSWQNDNITLIPVSKNMYFKSDSCTNLVFYKVIGEV